MDLSGRTALITGAAKRVGRAIAVRLAEGGCNVAVHYRGSHNEARECAELCRASGVAAETFQADLSDLKTLPRLVEQVVSHFGGLDVLVNNAAAFERMSLDEFQLAVWQESLAVNLTAPMVLAHAARDELRRRGGRIINMCDVATQRPWPSRIAYIVAKGGLETLTRVLARSFAPEVNVVGIAPGIAEFADEFDAAAREKLIAKVPLKRAGTPEDVAAAVHFVLSQGDYMTGAILEIDGGRRLV